MGEEVGAEPLPVACAPLGDHLPCTKGNASPGGTGSGPALRGDAQRFGYRVAVGDLGLRDAPQGSGTRLHGTHHGARVASGVPRTPLVRALIPVTTGSQSSWAYSRDGDDHEARKEGMQILHNRKSKPGSSDTYIICNVLDNSGLNISGNLLPCHYSLPLRWAARHESLEIWERARSSDNGGLIMALIFIECVPASPS